MVHWQKKVSVGSSVVAEFPSSQVVCCSVSCHVLACVKVALVFQADVGCAHYMSLLERCDGPTLVAAQLPVAGRLPVAVLPWAGEPLGWA